MGTNLRLSDELTAALRAEATRSGRSQQDVIRDAVAKEVGLSPDLTEMQRAVRARLVEAPEPFRDVEPTLHPPVGSSSLDLLDRDDR